MAALRNRAGYYGFALWFLLLFSSFSCSPNLSRHRLDIWCGLSANLRCRSETCCTRLAEDTGRKKSPKKSPSGHHCTSLSGYIFATKAHIDNRKKALNSNTCRTCPYNMVNFGPLAAEISPVVWAPRIISTIMALAKCEYIFMAALRNRAGSAANGSVTACMAL